MARSIFKREKLLADLRAMRDPSIEHIIEKIEHKQIGYTNPKPKPQVDQLEIKYQFSNGAVVQR